MQPHPAYADGGRVISGEVVVPGQAQVALPEGMSGSTGLDELGIDEIPTPRISIDHTENLYEDNQTKLRFESFNAIILGMIRQRAMFPKDYIGDGNDVPHCKSNDAINGLPNLDPTSRNAFPWATSSFDPNTVQINEQYGRVVLPCGSCNMTQWTGSDGKTPPKCSDVWNLIVMFDPYGNGQAIPAFLPLKRSALKPTRGHLAQYKQRNVPAFTDVVQFTLKQETRGKNPYSVPVIKVIGKTDPVQYESFAYNLEKLIEFARQIRKPSDGESGVQQEAFEASQYANPQPQPQYQPQQPPVAQQSVYQQPPVQQVATPASSEWHAPTQQAVPVYQAPQPPVAPQQVQPPVQYAPPVPAIPQQQMAQPVPPIAAPPIQVAPTPPPTPVPVAPQAVAPAPPVQEAAPVSTPVETTPTWSGASGPPAEDDDELPF